MLPRRLYHPADHLSIGIPLNHSHGVRCGQLLFVGGQADIDAGARVTRPDDLAAQTRLAMEGIERVLHGLEADTGDLVKLTAFYRLDHENDEDTILEIMAGCLDSGVRPGPAVTLVPLDAHCFDGLTIEIEGIAMRGENGEILPRSAAWIADGAPLPAAFSQAVRCGTMLFTSGQTAVNEDGDVPAAGSLVEQSRIVLAKQRRLLAGLGADLDDAVKANAFNVEPGDQEEWKAAALVRASHYCEPGPVATGLSLRRLPRDGLMVRYDVIAMRHIDGSRLPREGAWPTGHWDWPVHLPYRHGLKVGDLVFFGGQVSLTPDGAVIDPGDVERQTHTAMKNIDKVLAEFGVQMDQLVKVNTFYAGSGGQQELLGNARIRNEYYRDPGPVSTGIPFAWLAYEGMLIEIDGIAMV